MGSARAMIHSLKMKVSGSAGKAKIVIIGDANVGKSALLKTLVNQEFPENLPVDSMEEYTLSMPLQESDMTDLKVVTLPGQHDHEQSRERMYHKVDLALVCFPVADPMPSSPEHAYDGVCLVAAKNVVDYWVPELRRAAPNAAVILVGTKSDRRKVANKQGVASLTMPEIQALLEATNAVKYIEISAKKSKPEHVRELFQEAGKSAMKSKEDMRQCLVQ